MVSYHNFRKLEAWKRSVSFIKQIYALTTTFPLDERFGISDQLKRASVSIALNIAEGSNSGTNKEFIRFLRISLRSAQEVVAALEISKELNMGDQLLIATAIDEAEQLTLMIGGIIKHLNNIQVS